MLRVGTIVQHDGTTAVVVTADEQNEPQSAAILPGYADVDALIAAGDAWRPAADAALAGELVDVASLSWAPPVRRPGKVVCVALNNSANPDRIMRGPQTPAMFVK